MLRGGWYGYRRRGFAILLIVAMLFGASLWPLGGIFAAPTYTPTPKLGDLPYAFVPNGGQADAAVQFEVRRADGTVFFTAEGVTIVLPASDPTASAGRHFLGGESRAQASRSRVAHPPAVARLQFVGANAAPKIRPDTPLPGLVNYLRGNDPQHWQTDLPTYAAVVYEGLYPGIDLRYEGVGQALKGTYTVAPGADPAQIRWDYGAQARATVRTTSGALEVGIAAPGNGARDLALSEDTPVAWQERSGHRIPVTVTYRVEANGQIGFVVGDYDHSLPLIIDPTLTYSTYLGSGGNEDAQAVTVDGAGNAYVTGHTWSDDFPRQNPAQGIWGGQYDIFITKLNPTGTGLVYSTYLGGSGWDMGHGIAVDGAGRAAIAGTTDSIDFPIVTGYTTTYQGDPWDAYVAQLTPGGNAVRYSSYLGSAGDDQATGRQAIAVDGAGRLHVTGGTNSSAFPTKNGYAFGLGGTYGDAFLVTIDPAALGSASLVYGTLLGGDGFERGHGVTVTGTTAYVIGLTASLDFPVQNAAQSSKGSIDYGDYDAFVAAIDTGLSGDASLRWATYLGGTGYDSGAGVALDGNGLVVGGFTAAGDFPTLNAYQAYGGGGGDGFVARYMASTGARVWSTYLGGAAWDEVNGVAADTQGRAYLVGSTKSATFPTTPGGPQANRPAESCGGPPCADAFVLAVNTGGGGISYGTYLGGTNDDFGRGIALGGDGSAFVVGQTISSDFPITIGAYDTTKNPLEDMFVAKLAPATAGALPTADTIFDYDPVGRLTGVGPTSGNANTVTANGGTPGGEVPPASGPTAWWRVAGVQAGRVSALITVPALLAFGGMLGFVVLLRVSQRLGSAYRVRPLARRRGWGAPAHRRTGILALLLLVVLAPQQPLHAPLVGVIVGLGLAFVAQLLTRRFRRRWSVARNAPATQHPWSYAMVALAALLPLLLGGGAALSGQDARVAQAIVPTVAPQIAVGGQHNLVLKDDGTIWTWGSNSFSQLGIAPPQTVLYPIQVPLSAPMKALAAGGRHSLAVDADGDVWTWGDNQFGELGDGTTTPRSTPTQIGGVSNVVAVSASDSHSMALTASGTVFIWGSNAGGKLGIGGSTNDKALTPTQVPNVSDVAAVSAGRAHSLALKSDGTVLAWGNVGWGYGTGQYNMVGSMTPVLVQGLANVTKIAAGISYNAAVTGDGRVWTWGEDDNGQLGRPFNPDCNGLNPPNDCDIPQMVGTLTDVIDVVAGGFGYGLDNHTIALKSDGTLWAWGFGQWGQLGQNAQADAAAPTQVLNAAGTGAFSGAAMLAPGSAQEHALVADTDGNLWAWGFAPAGELTGVAPTSCFYDAGNNFDGRCSLLPKRVQYLDLRPIPYDTLHHCALSTPWAMHAGAGVCVTFGSFLTQETDISIPTRGVPLDLTRTYHSADPTDVGFGPGWSHQYAMSVVVEADGTRTVRLSDGRRVRYTTPDNVTFVPPPGFYYTLQLNAGIYTLKTPGQLLYTFDAAGRLHTIADRYGNTTTLDRQYSNRLRIVAPDGRTLDLYYGTGDYSRNIVTLQESANDGLGRKVVYRYCGMSGMPQ